jgi:hypothetical protein
VAIEATLALLADEAVGSIGHVFLVPQSMVLDKSRYHV